MFNLALRLSPNIVQAEPNFVAASDKIALRQAAFAELRRACGARPSPHKPPLSTGLPVLDEALSGGLPRGQIVEAIGESGRLSFVLWLLGQATRRKERTVLIDGASAFDPESALRQGVVLHRMLWVRATQAAQALRATDLTLSTGGLSLVVLYLVCGADLSQWGRAALWSKLVLRLQRAGSAMLLLADKPLAQSFAAATLSIRNGGTRWQTVPGGRQRLCAQDLRIEVLRNRLGLPGGVQPFTLDK